MPEDMELTTRNVITIKQGEAKSIAFSVLTGDVPLDLTNYEIQFEVKRQPYESVKPFITKTITSSSDPTTDGQITNPSGGQFKVRITQDDTNNPVGKYYLVITLIGGLEDDHDIVSSQACQTAIFRICKQ
jgi:hypothetical protein